MKAIIQSKKLRVLLFLVFILSGCSKAIALSTPNSDNQMSNETAQETRTAPLAFLNLQKPDDAGRVIFHEADEEIAYDWFSYIPNSLNLSEKNYIWITGLHGNLITDDYQQIVDETRSQIEWRTRLAEKYKLVIITPVIPRPETNNVYVVSIPHYVFLSDTPSFLQRPDEKLNLMIDVLLQELRDEGVMMHDKVFIDGFSAGGMFAQRYALLQPDRVQAMAAGQCGGAITLPVADYDSEKLQWPVGISDYSLLLGRDFDFESYKKIPQFIYIGDLDNNNSTLWGTGEMWRTQEQLDFLNNTFGDTDPIRIQNEVAYLNGNGFSNIRFKMYPNVPHQMTEQSINDVMSFFNSNRSDR